MRARAARDGFAGSRLAARFDVSGAKGEAWHLCAVAIPEQQPADDRKQPVFDRCAADPVLVPGDVFLAKALPAESGVDDEPQESSTIQNSMMEATARASSCHDHWPMKSSGK